MRQPKILLAAAVATVFGLSGFSLSVANAATQKVIGPGDSVSAAMESLAPGDTLILKGGEYSETVKNPAVKAGTASAPITMRAAPGERPVIRGLFWVQNPSYWKFDGINITWPSSASSGDHMVKITGGTGWSFANAEVWGAKSYAAMLIAGTPANWSVNNNYVHDTAKSNDTNQDHLIYVNANGTNGVVEHNRLANSVNGRAIKLGPPSKGSGVTKDVTIRYNTMYNNLGPSNVQIAWESSNNQVYGNIMQKSSSGRTAVTAYDLTGSGNVIKDNLVWEVTAAADADPGFTTSGNITADPQFANAPGGDFTPKNPAAAKYGHLANGRAQPPAPVTPTPPSSIRVPDVTVPSSVAPTTTTAKPTTTTTAKPSKTTTVKPITTTTVKPAVTTTTKAPVVTSTTEAAEPTTTTTTAKPVVTTSTTSTTVLAAVQNQRDDANTLPAVIKTMPETEKVVLASPAPVGDSVTPAPVTSAPAPSVQNSLAMTGSNTMGTLSVASLLLGLGLALLWYQAGRRQRSSLKG